MQPGASRWWLLTRGFGDGRTYTASRPRYANCNKQRGVAPNPSYSDISVRYQLLGFMERWQRCCEQSTKSIISISIQPKGGAEGNGFESLSMVGSQWSNPPLWYRYGMLTCYLIGYLKRRLVANELRVMYLAYSLLLTRNYTRKDSIPEILSLLTRNITEDILEGTNISRSQNSKIKCGIG